MSTAHRLPLPLRALNAAGRLARAAGLPLLELDPEALLDAAAAQSGLSDFGDARFREPLRRLFESYERDAGLTAFGRLAVRRDTLRLLENRLHLQDAWTRHPEILAGEIRAPLFVLGLPRTGTSILHELLAQDPASRVPMTWEVQRIWPPPERASFESDPRIAETEKHYAGVDQVLPEFRKIHRMGARLPQECVALTCHDFASLVFHTSHRVTSYQRWLDGADLRFVYESHRRQLQYLQWRCPAERWVLKSPGHLWALGRAARRLPGCPHRADPPRSAARARLARAPREGAARHGERPDRPVRDRRRLERAARRGARRAPSRCGARGALPEGRVFDIQFGEFVGNEIRDDPAPLRPLRHRSSPPRPRLACGATWRRTRRTERGPIATVSREAGLDAAAERRRFATYQEYFRVPDEPLP